MLSDLRATVRRAPDAGWEVTTLPPRDQPSATRTIRRAWRTIHHHGFPPIAWLLRGLWIITSAVPRWFFDVDTTKAMTAARHTDPAAYQQLSNAHDRRMDRHRSWWWAYALGALVPVAVAVWAVHDRAPQLVPHLPRAAALALIAAALVAGYSKPEPIPLADGEQAPIDRAHMDEALTAALPKVKARVKDDHNAIRYAGPAVRTSAGWRIEPFLPGGVTVTDARRAVDAIAAMLGRPRDVVVISKGQSEAHAVIDVLDAPLRDQPDPTYPYLDARTVDAWEPQPVGVDVFGRTVLAPIIGKHWIVGGKSGSGKSTAVRHRALTAILDPLVTVDVIDAGGAVDFADLRPLCEFWRAGWDRDDQAAFDQRMDWHEEEIARRRALMRRHPADFPTGAVTRDAAVKYGMRGYVLLIDEAHIVMQDTRRADRLTNLVRVARKFGYALWDITQYPDRTSIPPALSQQCELRSCFLVDTAGASNLVIGGDLAGQGFDASDLTQEDRGISWFVGSLGKPTMVRSFYVAPSQVASIVAQAAVDRGPALDVAPDGDVPGGLRGGLLAGWPTNSDGSPVAGVHLDEAADMLGWTTDTLRERMAEEGIPVNGDVRRKRGDRWRTRQGVKLADLTSVSGSVSDGVSDSVA